MKRRDLERHLRKHDAEILREGGSHTVWVRGEAVAAVPRHREVKPAVAVAICSALGVPKPPNAK